jgi:hypothetical protein
MIERSQQVKAPRERQPFLALEETRQVRQQCRSKRINLRARLYKNGVIGVYKV